MRTIMNRKTYSRTRNPHLTLPAQTMNQNGSWILLTPERRSCCAHERCASSVIQLHRSRGLFSGDSVPLCCIPFKCLSCQQCHMSCCKLRFQREVCWKKGVEKRGTLTLLRGTLMKGVDSARPALSWKSRTLSYMSCSFWDIGEDDLDLDLLHRSWSRIWQTWRSESTALSLTKLQQP